MSTETYKVTVIKRPAKNWSIWRVRNTTAGGANDYVCTRSFALAAMSNHIPELTDKFGLHTEEWYKTNTPTHIEYVTFLAEINMQSNGAWPANTDELVDASYESEREKEDKLAETLHHFYLAVFVKNPAHIDALPEVFGTTAFDWWWDDPTRNPTPEFGNQLKQEDLERFCEDIITGKYP